MKVAVIGSGIAGNVIAHRLQSEYDVTVFEAAGYVGGHSNTVDVFEDGRRIPIDTGFIVFNDKTYPNFIRLLDQIGQSSLASEMSFSVRAANGAIEYAGGSLSALFAQRRNLLRPSFHRMIADILRFNREAPAALDQSNRSFTIGEYLRENRYSARFIEHYLVPMAAAIWSAEPQSVLEMPCEFLLRFLANHGLLQLRDRPVWRVIEGGSREYVRKLTAGHADRIRLNSPVRSLARTHDGVTITTAAAGTERYDYAFVACHSDQALGLLADPTPLETSVLGNLRYQPNEAILHSDASVMPKRKRAWAAWNYHLPEDRQHQVAVTYNMNILQRLATREQYCVTLNDEKSIDPARIIQRFSYDHPIVSRAAVAAQARHADINSARTFYCGAYWRNGFHEDGVVSALSALQHFEERQQHAQLHLSRAS